MLSGCGAADAHLFRATVEVGVYCGSNKHVCTHVQVTAEYNPTPSFCRFDELGKEWRFPAKRDWISRAGGCSAAVDSPGARDVSSANGHWEKDQKGNRKWVASATGASAHAEREHEAGFQEIKVLCARDLRARSCAQVNCASGWRV